METETTLTWKTPQLRRLDVSFKSPYQGRWFVVRYSSQVDHLGDPLDQQYLGQDGKWYSWGAYFKTLQECINVLYKYEIDVVGPDHED